MELFPLLGLTVSRTNEPAGEPAQPARPESAGGAALAGAGEGPANAAGWAAEGSGWR